MLQRIVRFLRQAMLTQVGKPRGNVAVPRADAVDSLQPLVLLASDQ